VILHSKTRKRTTPTKVDICVIRIYKRWGILKNREMNQNQKDRQLQLQYETLLMKIYNRYDHSPELGIGPYMSNLIDSERGKSNVQHLGTTKDLLGEVKGFLIQGVDDLLRNNSNIEDRALINANRDLIGKASSSTALETPIESLRRFLKIGLDSK